MIRKWLSKIYKVGNSKCPLFSVLILCCMKSRVFLHIAPYMAHFFANCPYFRFLKELCKSHWWLFLKTIFCEKKVLKQNFSNFWKKSFFRKFQKKNFFFFEKNIFFSNFFFENYHNSEINYLNFTKYIIHLTKLFVRKVVGSPSRKNLIYVAYKKDQHSPKSRRTRSMKKYWQIFFEFCFHNNSFFEITTSPIDTIKIESIDNLQKNELYSVKFGQKTHDSMDQRISTEKGGTYYCAPCTYTSNPTKKGWIPLPYTIF